MNKESNERLSGMIGLAARGRMLASGTDIACDNVRSGKSHLLLVSADASANTKKRVFNCAKYYESACYEIPLTPDLLGHAIGKESLISAVAVLNGNMAKGIMEFLDKMNAQTSEADSNPREV